MDFLEDIQNEIKANLEQREYLKSIAFFDNDPQMVENADVLKRLQYLEYLTVNDDVRIECFVDSTYSFERFKNSKLDTQNNLILDGLKFDEFRKKQAIYINVKQFEELFSFNPRQQMTYRDKENLPYYKVSKKGILYNLPSRKT